MGIAEKRNLGEDNVFKWKLALPWLLILSCYLNATPVDICEKKIQEIQIYHKTIFKLYIHKSTINNTKYFQSDMR